MTRAVRPSRGPLAPPGSRSWTRSLSQGGSGHTLQVLLGTALSQQPDAVRRGREGERGGRGERREGRERERRWVRIS